MEEQIAKIYEIVESMKTVVDDLMNENKNLKDRQNELESLLYDQVLNPAKEAFDKHEYDCGLNEFKERYSEKLGPYEDSMKAIEGDDFDLLKETYDGFKSYKPEEGEEMPTEDVYVDAMVDKVKTTLDYIREKLGASTVTAEVTEDGNLDVKADGETVAEEVIEDAEKETDGETSTEETAEETKKEDSPEEIEKKVEISESIPGEEPEGEDSPEEIEAFMKELEKEMENVK